MAANPNLSAKQFVKHVNETGGATMNVHSGKLLQPRRKAYVVGGAEHLPTRVMNAGELNTGHVLRAMQFLDHTSNRPALGAWTDSQGKVELDASEITHRPGEAVRKGRSRGEQSVWDNRHMKEISLA